MAVDSSVSGILEPTVGRAGAPPGTSAAPGGPLSSLQYCALPDTDAGGGSSYARCWPVMTRLAKLFVILGYFPSHPILHVKNPRLREKGLPTISFNRSISIQCRSTVCQALGRSLGIWWVSVSQELAAWRGEWADHQ